MRCYLIRHVQTDWNHQNRLQGHTDSPVSVLGAEQLARLTRYFAGRRLSAVYTSDLPRSRRTAEAIAGHHRLTPTVIAELAEMHLGAWEGLTPEEISARFADAYQTWRCRPSGVRIPGGEPVEGFRVRVREAFLRIIANHQDGEEVVVVTHGGVIASWLAEWMGADYDQLLHRLVLDNAGVSAVECRKQPPCVLWINATAHLA